MWWTVWVATVGANKKAALETLETIRYCKTNGFATICGLSNISFGMPERSFVNTAFLTLAIKEGLTMAIANPSQELLVSCALAADLLLNKEGAEHPLHRVCRYGGGKQGKEGKWSWKESWRRICSREAERLLQPRNRAVDRLLQPGRVQGIRAVSPR